MARLIETDIVPQLLLAHRDAVPTRTNGVGAIAAGLTEDFAGACLHEEVAQLLGRVEVLLAAGIDVETVYLQLLAPAARQLGTLWEADDCDFVHVTMGLWRLQELVHALGAMVPGRAPLAVGTRRILLSPMPGEQHSFGVTLLEDFFRRAGWQTWTAPCLDQDELTTLIAGREFDMLALSVGVDRHLHALPRLLLNMRQLSRNRDLQILVGGRIFCETPELAVELGADGTAADGLQAVAVAENLLTRRLRSEVTRSL